MSDHPVESSLQLRSITRWRLVLILALGYTLTGAVLPHARADLGNPRAYWIPLVIGTLGIIPFFIGVFACRVRVGGSADLGWPAGLRLARQEGWFGERLAVFAASLVILPLFFWAFAAWKMWVPPFTWDAELAVLDRAVHGGDPYTLIPQSPRLAWLMDRFYWSWNYLFVGVIVWQVWAGSPAERARFWLAFVLTWVGLGTVLAHLFASAGPCFYPQLTGGPGPYGPLLSNLEAADRQYGLHLFNIREYLWRTVQGQEVVLGGGISAFPSLHVALPTLAACAAWRVSPWLAAGFGIYTAALTVCSVGLGWHYAVDGYVSILLVPLIWKASGWWAERSASPGLGSMVAP